jgi:hypothetical protein
MRTFLSTHWKSIVALVILVLVAVLTMSPSNGRASPDLAARLRQHVQAIASSEQNTATPAALELAARYIETTLSGQGYQVQHQEYQAAGVTVRNIEVSLANVTAGTKPKRIFIIGAHYDSEPGAPGANDNGSGTAAVLELARLLKGMHPSQGTEVKFVFFTNKEPSWFMGQDMVGIRHAEASQRAGHYPDTGNFIAFVGTRESSSLVAQALAAFRGGADFPAEGLAAPAWVQGVTLSDHAAFNRYGYPALMITDTAFLRYPYFDTADDIPDQLDYESIARVIAGLSHTLTALAGTTAG